MKVNRTTYEPEFNSAANEQTFSWLQQQAESHHIGFDGGLIFFAQGGAAMARGTYSSAITEGSVYSVAPWPRSPYTGRAVTMMSASMYVVNPHTANTPELMDLIEEFNRSQDDIYVRFATRVKNTNYDETMTASLAAGDYDVLWLAVPRDTREAVRPFMQGRITVEEALRRVEQTAARYSP